jgi:hypothetical protein
MALTTGSMVYYCSLQLAMDIADIANLREEISLKPYGADYYMWQDKATGGGGARLVWTPRLTYRIQEMKVELHRGLTSHHPEERGILWVSRHSGYAYADMTETICALLEEEGAYPCLTNERTPYVYGDRR